MLWLQLDDIEHEATVADRGRLVAAIDSRDPPLARDLAEAHVAADTGRLLQLRLRIYDLDRAGGAP